MNAKNLDLKSYRQILEKEQKKIEREISSLSSQDPHAHTERVYDNAASDTEGLEVSDHDRISAEVEELNDMLEEIHIALSRIDDGTYGTCVGCGSDIDAARLTALPTAKTCLSCQKAK